MNALADDSCPEPAVLGAYIDGTLTRERAANVTHHVSRCAKCRFIVESACEVEQEVQTPVRNRPAAARFRWPLAVAASLALVAVALLLSRGREERPRTDPIARLVAASPRSTRTLEPRLSGGFNWAELRAVRRSNAAQKSAEELVASGAAGVVLRELNGQRTPQALHASGVAYLVAGDPVAAVPLLEQATRGAEGNARVWSDLSAALYASAKRDDRLWLERALEAADRAVRLNPRLSEAYFNRALILDRIGTPQQRAAAWGEYLQRDPTGGWAKEAREKLSRIAP